MHCNVSQWFITHFQRFPWMHEALSNDGKWFHIVQRLGNDSQLRSIQDTQSLQYSPLYNALHTACLPCSRRRSVAWQPWGDYKTKSAYWLDINFLGQSNGPLVWMDRNRKYSCFHYLYTSNIENILTDENKQKQTK